MQRISRFTSRGLGTVLSPRSSLFWTVLVSVIALCVVAFLQYHWTTQVNNAQEIRIGSDLQTRMMDWHLDLYREFAAICVALQVGPDSGAQDGWNAYAQRYSDWKHNSSTPDVVKGVYLWESSRPSKPRFLRMDGETSRIETQAPPSELGPLLDRLQAHSSNLPVALRAWQRESPSSRSVAEGGKGGRQGISHSDTITGWQFDAQIGAIVHPIFHHQNPYENPRFSDLFALYQNEKLPGTRNAVDWIIVVLDRDKIEKKTLSALTNRYFQEEGTLAYKVAVTAAGEGRSLYSSDADFPGPQLAKAAATMKIFGPPPESTEGHFWQAVQRGESLRLEDWRSFAGPVWFPVFQNGSEASQWTLAVQRRGDPLEVTLARTRRRNLATSGGVFFLLALSMSLVLIASHRAQRLAQLQMDFVAAVSHELRTPLTVICSAAENIVDGLVDSKQQVARYGSVIRNQGRQLTALVDQVLLFASTQDARHRYQVRSLNVHEILKSVLSNTAALAERGGITIEQDVPSTLPQVMADLAVVSQCLQNLIVNALKFSGDSRWIGIRARVEESGARTEVQISIQDKGIGISSADLPHIFEPFYRSPEVNAAQIHGTGLGLTLARRIAEAMGGRITVTSKPGLGSVFTLHLVPATESATSPMRPMASSNTEE